jgi:nucleoside phosphorylase
MKKRNDLIIAIPTKFEAKNIVNVNNLIITGVGKKSIKAIQAISKKTANVTVVLAGFCGCNDKSVPIGKTFVINKVVNGKKELVLDDDRTFCKDLERATIETIDSYGKGALVDMESFWVTEKCKELGLPLKIIRVVSDHCDMDPMAVMDIFKFRTKEIPGNFKIASESLSHIVHSIMCAILQ